jgi:hypothetical protein
VPLRSGVHGEEEERVVQDVRGCFVAGEEEDEGVAHDFFGCEDAVWDLLASFLMSCGRNGLLGGFDERACNMSV